MLKRSINWKITLHMPHYMPIFNLFYFSLFITLSYCSWEKSSFTNLTLKASHYQIGLGPREISHHLGPATNSIHITLLCLYLHEDVICFQSIPYYKISVVNSSQIYYEKKEIHGSLLLKIKIMTFEK